MESDKEFCLRCQKTVEPEGKLDVTGITNICPECGLETIPKKKTYSAKEIIAQAWASL